MEEPQPLLIQFTDEKIDASCVAPGAAKAGDKTESDRVFSNTEYDGYCVVAFLAATVAGVLLGIAMTLTFRCTKSAANWGNRSY